MDEALIEVPTMRRFAGIELISDRIPDETRILTFRHLLDKHELVEQIYETVQVTDDNPVEGRFCLFIYVGRCCPSVELIDTIEDLLNLHPPDGEAQSGRSDL